MARFRKRAKARRSFFKARTKKSSVSSKPEMLIIPAMAYGAGRKYLSDIAQPITTQIAGVVGSYADELAFGLLGWYVAKKNVFGLKKVGEAMLVVESASVGNQLIQGIMPTNTGSSDSNKW